MDGRKTFQYAAEIMGVVRAVASPSQRSTSASRRWIDALLLVVVLALFAADVRRPRAQIDDAFISYQYARNLVEGRGLVFNPGEYVEGYTNLLWTLLVAGGMALGRRAEWLGWVLGATSGAAMLVATYLYATAVLEAAHAWAAAAACGVVLAAASFGVWTLQGMETPLFAAAAIAALAAQARGRPWWATVFAIAATLTRPEGALVAAVVLGAGLVDTRGRAASAWAPIVGYTLVLALVTVFRLAYYGAPLPNTFYAKVGGVPVLAGVGYLLGFLLDGAGWLVMPAVVGAWADRRTWPGAAFVVATTAYVVAIGGDAFDQWRFFVPVLPCLAVLAVRGIEHACARRPTAGIALGATVPLAAWQLALGASWSMLAACTMLVVAWVAGARGGRTWMPAAVAAAIAVWIGRAAVADRGATAPTSKRAQAISHAELANSLQDANARRVVARLLAQRPPPRLVATGGVGRLGWYSRLPILDVLGIIDPVVARSRETRPDTWVMAGHHRSDAAYVMAREPDYLVIPRPGDFMRLPALVAIWEHPDFATRYVWDSGLEIYRRRRDD